MPIVRDILLNLQLDELLRSPVFGKNSNLKSEMKDLMHELLTKVNDSHLLEPAIAYEIHKISSVGHDRVSLESGAVLHGSILPSVFSEAEEMVVVVCTIGPKLVEQVTDYFNGNEPLRGLLLDGIGNAAVNSVAQESCELMMREASRRGLQASGSLSPGGGRFPISEQWQLFELVPAEEIGVKLTSAGVMVPRKSVSMVIGMGPQMPTWTRAEACVRCNLSKTCHYRIRA